MEGKKIEIQNGELKVPDNPIIPIIYGDGIGPEVTSVARDVISEAVTKAYSGKRKIIWKEIHAGEAAKEREEEASDFERRVFIYSKFRKAAGAVNKLYLKSPSFCRGRSCEPTSMSHSLRNLGVKQEDLGTTFRKILNKLPNLSILREETVASRIEIDSVIK